MPPSVKPETAEEYFRAANSLKETGQLYTAMVAYQQALAMKPDYAEAHKKLAEIYIHQGKLSGAIASCEEAIKINPNFAAAYLTLGNAYQSQKQFQPAIDAYSKTIAIKPNFPQAHANLGSVYYQKGQLELAIVFYKKALDINPKLASISLMLGNVLTQLGRVAEASSCYQAALELQPRNPLINFKLGLIFAKQGNISAAKKCYQKALAKQPNYPEAYEELYRLLKPSSTEEEIRGSFPGWQQFVERYAAGNSSFSQEAIDSYFNSLETPGTANNYLKLESETDTNEETFSEIDEDRGIQPETFHLAPRDEAATFAKETDTILSGSEGIETAETSEKITTFNLPPSPEASGATIITVSEADIYRQRADLCLRQGKLTEAIAASKEALKIQPEDAGSYLNLGNAFYRQNKPEAALRSYLRSAELEPNLPETYANIGSAYSQLKRDEEAIFYYQKALAIKSDLVGVYWNLGKIYQQQAKVDEAVENWEKAFAIQPDLVDDNFHFGLGNTLFKMGKREAAMRSYQRAIAVNPNNASACGNLANLYSKDRNRDEAIKYYKQALEINPKLHSLHYQLGNNYLLKCQYDEAILSFREALKYNPTYADIYANLAGAYASKGELPEAIKNYRQALVYKPEWAEVYCRIGHIIKQEKHGEAIALFEKAISLKPDYIEAHQQLCDILSHTTNLAKAREAADKYWENCGESAPILSGVSYLFSYFQSGLSVEALAKLMEIESYCFQNIETMSSMEVKLIYELVLFSIPHLRDDVEKNFDFNKLIAGSYYSDRQKYAPPKIYPSLALERGDRGSHSPKIGFISKHYRRHSVGWCSEALIKELTKITEVNLYVTGPVKRDDVSDRFEKIPHKFYWPKSYPNGFASYEELTEQIAKDNIDILIDLDSMTVPVNAHILFQEPAPVCLSWLGFDAPCVSSNHYFLCDWHTHPPGMEKYYMEKLIRLPETAVAVGGFEIRAADRVELRKTLGIGINQMVYLCVAPGRKTNPEMLRAQVEILRQVPGSILLRKGQGDVDIIHSSYRQECEKLGVDFSRIKFLGQTQTEEEHRAVYLVADVLLDSYPYNGGTHNLEALWANLPVITRTGNQYLSRMGY
ncbi:MAG: tetratricopeptide repeat protein, partial [Cyanobacteriota bacterium]|nr:tetratricopeptide repeat protein [Cyanobacteriota bacterium]